MLDWLTTAGYFVLLFLFMLSVLYVPFYVWYFSTDYLLWRRLQKEFKGFTITADNSFAKLHFVGAQQNKKTGQLFHSFIIPNGMTTYTVYDLRNVFWAKSLPLLSQTLIVSMVRPNATNFVLTHHQRRDVPLNTPNRRFFPSKPNLPLVETFRPKPYPYLSETAPFVLYSAETEPPSPMKRLWSESGLPFKELPTFWLEQHEDVLFCVLSLNNRTVGQAQQWFHPPFFKTDPISKQIGHAIDVLTLFAEPVNQKQDKLV